MDWLTETTGSRPAWRPAPRCGGGCRTPRSGSSGPAPSARRPGDPGDGGVQHDGAVHLRQLAEAGGGELDVQGEAAGAQRLDRAVVAEHDQGAGATAQDPLQPVAQLGARRHSGQGVAQQLVGRSRPVSSRHVAASSPPSWRAGPPACAHVTPWSSLPASVAKNSQRRRKVADLCDVHTGREQVPGSVGTRPAEPEPRRLGEAALHPGDAPDLAASPTSPTATRSAGSGRSAAALATARAVARSAAGSLRRTPPTWRRRPPWWRP
jgi:hypothetical protein